MPASTRRYFGFDFYKAVLQKNNAGSIAETTLLYANKLELNPDEETITFEGDGQTKNLYLTKGLTVEYTPDTIDLNAISALFGKTEITAGLPSGLAALTWMLDTTEAAGVSAGIYGEAYAVKDVAGVQSSVKIRLWVPVGTLAIGKPPGFNTSAKADQMLLRLTAVRTSVDIAGTALPTVPAGGAMYAIAELT